MLNFFVFYFPSPMKTYIPSYDTEYHTNQCNKVTTLKTICQMCSKESNKSIMCAIVNKFSIFHPPLLCEVRSMTKVLNKSFSIFPFVTAYRFISTFCFVCALLFDRHIWRFVYQIPNKTHTNKERKNLNMLTEPLKIFMANSLLNVTSAKNRQCSTSETMHTKIL